MSRKVGLHVIGGSSVPLGRPAVVKLCDPSSEYVAQVRQQVGPDTLIVVRWTLAEQPLDNPQVRAYWWYARHMNSLLPMLNHKPIAFEGYNEIADDQAEQYCRFEVARMQHLHTVGANAVLGNFSVGTPDFPIWDKYQPMLDAMRDSDYLGLHEYWADWESLHNTYHVRRFQRVPELFGRRIVITECGRDVVEGRGQPGWKRSDMRVDSYIAELAELGRLYDACPQVVGAAVFTVGGFGWGDFDVSEIWPHVVARYAEPAPVEPSGRWVLATEPHFWQFDGVKYKTTTEMWEGV
jgi:hypothetical protein